MLSDLLENCDRVLRPSHLSRLVVAPFPDWSWYSPDRHGAIIETLRKSGSPTTCLGKKGTCRLVSRTTGKIIIIIIIKMIMIIMIIIIIIKRGV